jgi:hypothetical protein
MHSLTLSSDDSERRHHLQHQRDNEVILKLVDQHQRDNEVILKLVNQRGLSDQDADLQKRLNQKQLEQDEDRQEISRLKDQNAELQQQLLHHQHLKNYGITEDEGVG